MANKVEICGVNTSTLPKLKNSEMVELMERIKAGDEYAKELFIQANLRLVLSVVNRFSGRENDFDDLKDIAWNIREMSNFLRSKQATVGGNREIDRSILESFRSKGVIVNKNEEKALFDLLNSDTWEELKKTYYGSQDAMDMLIQVTNRDGKTTLDWDRLQEQLEKVRTGELTMDIALEEFGYKI